MFEDVMGSTPPEFVVPYLYKVGEVIDGRFVVKAQLGQGGMGAVLRVEDKENLETFALKYCQPGEDRRRFAREVRMMEAVKSDHVISVVHSNLEFDPPYFIMPLADRSLQNELGTLIDDEATGLEIFRQICLGVQSLHEQKIYHRDLKPANVLLLPDGRVVVSDLGLGKFEDRDTTVLTRTIHQIGTEDYLAPEQRQPEGSRKADARTDVYQLGKVLYQILTNRPPRWIDYDKLPKGLDHIIQRAVAENPSDRYQNVERLEAALSSYRSSKDPVKNPREVLDRLLNDLKVKHRKNVPEAAELKQVLEVLSHGAWLDHSLVVECFHSIPIAWLSALVEDHEAELFPVLSTYTTAIHEICGGYNFSFADTVADRMKPIYEETASIRMKVLALRNIMTSAERLGRFRPQALFCGYLQGIKTIELALPIAEMITEHARPHLENFQGYNIDLYHPAIQEALRQLHAPQPFVMDEDDEE